AAPKKVAAPKVAPVVAPVVTPTLFEAPSTDTNPTA
ncbi:MAG: hypothetical protein RLZZ309_410, partial [Bacteroidota bacterium]